MSQIPTWPKVRRFAASFGGLERRPHGAYELAHPEPDFYIVGSKSYGRAPTFLLATGYEQARSVAAMIAGDHEAALRVELDLPETGVCKSDLAESDSAGCGAPGKSACC